ncbi:MAG: hypothetical protein ACT4NY_01075 [Pseudonocardiales bacterium]
MPTRLAPAAREGDWPGRGSHRRELTVAVIPAVAGLGSADYTDPVAFGAGFRGAMLISAGLLTLGGQLYPK